MKTKKKMIVGNWKMNPATMDESKKIIKGITKAAEAAKKVDVVVCPPFIFLSEVKKAIAKAKIALGSQDIYFEDAGSRTGFVSPVQVAGVGTKYTIIGHSERRDRGETDEMVNQKISAALRNGLTPIFCIGEKERHSNGDYLEHISMQIQKGFATIAKTDLQKVVIAYEPVWAIGAKTAMTPHDIYEMVLYIKKVLREKYDAIVSESVAVLYGGSANAENAEAIIKDGEVDGLLVGREALVPENFSKMILVANNIKAKK